MRSTGAVVGIVLAVVVPAAPAVASADTPPLSSSHRAFSTAVSAHRALDGSGGAENSLASFQRAARSGETDIEGDVRATKDGSFVMSHDASLRTPRCAGPYLDVPLRALTLAQVGKMTCSGEPVARLADVIDVVRPYPAAILRVEVKHAGTDASTVRTSDAVRLAKTLAGAGMTARSIVQDFDWATTTRAVRTASPTQRVSALAGTLTVADGGVGPLARRLRPQLCTGCLDRLLEPAHRRQRAQEHGVDRRRPDAGEGASRRGRQNGHQQRSLHRAGGARRPRVGVSR